MQAAPAIAPRCGAGPCNPARAHPPPPPPLARCLRCALCRWRRLDVAPFLCVYALWAAWALELLIKEGGAKLGVIQLVTTAVLALHVS